jgi:4-amino-4-deoxy-L-arabinose transferase-like glycosyltransferase
VNTQVTVGFAVLLAILACQLALTAKRTSITWDEDDHIYAGYMSLKRADFGLNPEHPPLVKQLAAIPLLPMTLKIPTLQGRKFKHEAFLGGKDFVFGNNPEAILLRARMAAALLTLLLAGLVFLAAREMFGVGGAFIALALFVFDPNVLAHGAVVGTDMGLTCFMFAAIYAFYRYVRLPSLGRLTLVGVATGLALASKHTGILVVPMLVLLLLTEVFRRTETPESDSTGKRARRLAVAFVGISAIALATLWAFYGFRYTARGEGLTLNPPLAESIHHLTRPREARLLETVARYHLLPESYIYGLADVRIMSDFYTSYLFGKIYPHGTWFYFPAAFAIKSTLPLLLLLGVAGLVVAGRLRCWRELLLLTIPPAFHLAIAMSAGMNIGLRHILPMYPFLYVLAAGAAWKLMESNRRWAYAVAALIVFQAVTTTRAYPAYMAYANELWGGPSQTYKYLSDSNADWGQQLKSTKAYLEKKDIKECWFIYFAEGPVHFRDYGIPCKPLLTIGSLWLDEEVDIPPSVDGPVLISAGTLSGFEFGPGPLNPYEVFKHRQADDVIDYAVFLFNGHFEIPLAAWYSHAQKAQFIMRNRRLEEALAEAQQSLALASDSVNPNVLVGDILVSLGHPDEARRYYEKALAFATTVQPEFQVGWVNALQEKLRAE